MGRTLSAVFGAGCLIASLSGFVVAAAPSALAAPDASGAATSGAEPSAPDGDESSGGSAPEAGADESDAGGTSADQGDNDHDAVDLGNENLADADEDLADEAEQELAGEAEQVSAGEPEQELADAAEPESADEAEQELTDTEQDAAYRHIDIPKDREAVADEVGGPAGDEPPAPSAFHAAEHTEAPGDATSPDPVAAGLTMASATVADDVGEMPTLVSAEPVTASVPVGATSETPPRPTLLNLVGSVVVNLLVGLIQLIDGPPVLPANSTVTVRTSSLNLPIGNGRSVQSDWYFPADINEETRFVYLQHGFLATGPMYSFTAADLAERTNSIVVAPSLSSNFFAPDAAWVGWVDDAPRGGRPVRRRPGRAHRERERRCRI